MTIIYYYQKNRQKITFNPKKNHFRVSFKKRISSFKKLPQFGFIKTSCFLIAPFVFVFLCWLFVFSQNISLNYQIYRLKRDIDNLNKEIGLIRDKNLEKMSSADFEKWLSENKFIQVKKISYLDLSLDNVAFKK
jgi:hypothetical protein